MNEDLSRPKRNRDARDCLTVIGAFGSLRTCTTSRQYLVAVAVGATAAGVATSLEVIATISLGLLADYLLFSLLLALPFGAVAGSIALSIGLLVRRLLRLTACRPRVSAVGAGVGVLVVGLGFSVVIALIPPHAPFIWAPVLASFLGSVGLYAQSSIKP